jgi:hypothetical protein
MLIKKENCYIGALGLRGKSICWGVIPDGTALVRKINKLIPVLLVRNLIFVREVVSCCLFMACLKTSHAGMSLYDN